MKCPQNEPNLNIITSLSSPSDIPSQHTEPSRKIVCKCSEYHFIHPRRQHVSGSHGYKGACARKLDITCPLINASAQNPLISALKMMEGLVRFPSFAYLPCRTNKHYTHTSVFVDCCGCQKRIGARVLPSVTDEPSSGPEPTED